MIEVRNLAFSYRDRPVLRDVSFVVSPGEVVSVIGGNGAGKTTLLRILATLAVPERGTILMEGQDVFLHTLKYRRQLGYLPWRPALYDDMTIKDYLYYRARLRGEPEKRVRRRVNEAAELCRISGSLRSTIRTLSAGQYKRVALADALLLRPRILLLDDFLSGLDREFRETTGTILSTAAAFSSVIVTGHELEDHIQWASRLLILKNGTISDTLETAGLEASVLRERLTTLLNGGAT